MSSLPLKKVGLVSVAENIALWQRKSIGNLPPMSGKRSAVVITLIIILGAASMPQCLSIRTIMLTRPTNWTNGNAALSKNGRSITKKKSVSFGDDIQVSVNEIIHVDDISREQIAQIWWTSEEKDECRKEYEAVLFLMETGKPVDENEHAARGLEKRTQDGAWELYEIQRDAQNAVLCEQDLQKKRKIRNANDIALAFQTETLKARKAALEVAMRDEDEVKEYLGKKDVSMAPAKHNLKSSEQKEDIAITEQQSPTKHSMLTDGKWSRRISKPLMETVEEKVQKQKFRDGKAKPVKEAARKAIVKKKKSKKTTKSSNQAAQDNESASGQKQKIPKKPKAILISKKKSKCSKSNTLKRKIDSTLTEAMTIKQTSCKQHVQKTEDKLIFSDDEKTEVVRSTVESKNSAAEVSALEQEQLKVEMMKDRDSVVSEQKCDTAKTDVESSTRVTESPDGPSETPKEVADAKPQQVLPISNEVSAIPTQVFSDQQVGTISAFSMMATLQVAATTTPFSISKGCSVEEPVTLEKQTVQADGLAVAPTDSESSVQAKSEFEKIQEEIEALKKMIDVKKIKENEKRGPKKKFPKRESEANSGLVNVAPRAIVKKQVSVRKSQGPVATVLQ